MNLQQQRIQALCQELRLPALQAEWPALAQRAADTQASFADFLTTVLESEQSARLERTRQALLKLATLPAVKTLESYDFAFATGAPKAQMRAPAHDGQDSGRMPDSIPAAWRTVLRSDAGQFWRMSGTVSVMPGTLSA